MTAYTCRQSLPTRVGSEITRRTTKTPKSNFFSQFLNGCLPLEDGSDRRETLAKRVSDDLQFFIFRPWKKKWPNFCKNFRGRFFSKKVRFWRSYDFFIPVGRCVVKSYCPNCPYFWGDFLGGGVNDSICVFNLDLGPKMTSTIWCYNIIVWYDDTMIVCFCDSLILRII